MNSFTIFGKTFICSCVSFFSKLFPPWLFASNLFFMKFLGLWTEACLIKSDRDFAESLKDMVILVDKLIGL